MRNTVGYRIIAVVGLLLLASCANITRPTGGDKDTRPPRLLSVSPKDSLLNTRVTRIELHFDEFVSVTNATTEVQTSPILAVPPVVEGKNKHVVIKIQDSVLRAHTTYKIHLGKAIVDVNENNAFSGYEYVFSTGSYFDSLLLSGQVINAATGFPDTAATIVLYEAHQSDSIVFRTQPEYTVKTDGNGYFRFQGLPQKSFKLFALHDANNNLLYDGTNEWIAFYDSLVTPTDTIAPSTSLTLYISSESDTADSNTPQATTKRSGSSPTYNAAESMSPTKNHANPNIALTYTVDIDTTDIRKRTQDITAPITIHFSKSIKTIQAHRINLSIDSAGTLIEAPFHVVQDSLVNNKVQLHTSWKSNSLYTLRLLKNFAIDSNDAEALPSKYHFRTKAEEDYATLKVHVPSAYYGKAYVMVLLKDNQVTYQQPITDTTLVFARLQPATYSMRIILDKNQNGKWDPVKFLARQQPEKVLPHNHRITLKAGWENIVDFTVWQPTTNSSAPARLDKKR